MVAKAIYDSEIPVISAVGHEPDVTISDYVADLRAATPSNAAELAVPDQDALRQTLDSMENALVTAAMHRITGWRRQLKVLSSASAIKGPGQYIALRRTNLAHLQTRLAAAQGAHLNKKQQKFVAVAAKLDMLSPLKVISRGYAIVENEDGKLIRSANQVDVGDSVNLTVSDGQLTAQITAKKEAHPHEQEEQNL